MQVHLLFGSSGSTDADSPFITILAVDPHIIIRGLEHNLHSQFHESSINGHDYLRTVVQLPLFIQNHAQPPRQQAPPPRNHSVTRADQLSALPNERAENAHHVRRCFSVYQFVIDYIFYLRA